MNKSFGVTCFVALLSNFALSASYPFAEDFEGGPGHWITNGTWGLTTAFYKSPSRSATDSPGAFYTNNTDAALTLASGMNLSAAVRPAARFYVRHALEQAYDYALFEVSTNAGANWVTRLALTGNQGAWRRYQVALSNYAGAADVRVRFRIVTDSSIVMDGAYVDDVFIGAAPAPVPIQSVTASQTQ